MDEDAEGGARILVVDDDTSVRTLLRRLLTTEGYAVDEAADGPTALDKVGTFGPDLLLLDIMMPGQDGLDVLEGLRQTSDVPVILLSAKGDEAHRVLAFRFGADDYVVKPFSTAELVGRIGAVLRRTGNHRPKHELRFDGLCIDPATRKVTVHGRAVDLPAREYELLAFLASSPQQVFSRDELLERLWPHSAERNPATVTEHIGRIRRRIEDDPEQPRWVRTVRGIGYRFDP
ncbi:MAG: response regulator transcription factor [Actinomycetota bacterium]|nr:response regulator transcription factor [Actinomycetota bacterium]